MNPLFDTSIIVTSGILIAFPRLVRIVTADVSLRKPIIVKFPSGIIQDKATVLNKYILLNWKYVSFRINNQ